MIVVVVTVECMKYEEGVDKKKVEDKTHKFCIVHLCFEIEMWCDESWWSKNIFLWAMWTEYSLSTLGLTAAKYNKANDDDGNP